MSIETDVADLHFVASEDGVCRVECVNFANESYAVNVDNGTLTIAKDDDRAWHENIRLFSIGDTYVRIYMPEESYTSLEIHESTSLSADSDTGDIAQKNVIVDELLTIKTDTGDLVFDCSDAAEIFVQTNTGDVTGTLISAKVFLIETNTGDVDVPKSVTGARCEIITDTGDIELSIDQ